jgi:competence protein ComEC
MYKTYQLAETVPLVISLFLLVIGYCYPDITTWLQLSILIILWISGAIFCVYMIRVPLKIVSICMWYFALLMFVWLTIIQLQQDELLQFPFPLKQIHTISGTIRTDGAISEQNNTVLSILLDSASTSRNDTGSAQGSISVLIPSKRNNFMANQHIIASGTPIEIDGSFVFFAENIKIVCDEPLLVHKWRLFRTNTINELLRRLDSLRFNTRELCSGLLLGRFSAAGASLREQSIMSGCAHILALSGMHLHVILAVLVFFLRKIKKKIIISLLSICFSLLYVGIIGPKPSLVRACIMGILGTLLIRSSGKTIITCSLIIHTLLVPKTLISTGSILSYYSLFGIVYGSQFISARLSSYMPRNISMVIATTCSASFFTAPLSFLLFDSWRIIGLLISPVVAPLALFILLGSFLYVLVPSTLIGKCLDSVADVFLKITQWGAAWSLSHEHLNRVSMLILSIIVMLTVIALLQYASHVERKRSLSNYDLGFSLRFPASDNTTSL